MPFELPAFFLAVLVFFVLDVFEAAFFDDATFDVDFEHEGSRIYDPATSFVLAEKPFTSLSLAIVVLYLLAIRVSVSPERTLWRQSDSGGALILAVGSEASWCSISGGLSNGTLSWKLG